MNGRRHTVAALVPVALVPVASVPVPLELAVRRASVPVALELAVRRASVLVGQAVSPVSRLPAGRVRPWADPLVDFLPKRNSVPKSPSAAHNESWRRE